MGSKFIIIFYFFLIQISFAQGVEEKTDSLLHMIKMAKSDSVKANIYYSLAKLNLYNAPLKTVQFCREQIILSEKIGNNESIALAYVQMFNAQLYYGALSDTLLHTIQLYEEHVNSYMGEEDLLKVYWIYALYYDNTKQTDKEIEAYIKALNIANKNDYDKNIKGALLGNIANILLKQAKYQEASDYSHKSLQFITDTIGLAESYYRLGLINIHEKKYEKALNFIRLSYDYYRRGRDTKGMALSLIEEGKYYDKKSKFQKANLLYNQATELIKENNIGSLLPTIYISLAEHYHQREDYKAVIHFGEQSLGEIKKQKNYEKLSSTYEILHKAYAKLAYFQKAYEIRSEEIIYKDSTNNSELLAKVEALKTEFEVEQKEIENQLLKAETVSNQQTIQSRNITTIALFLGLLLLLSWALNVYRNDRQKQKYNEQLKITVSERTQELQKANKDLVQANYELKTFNHIASHDIKEPMRNIGSHIGLVYRTLPKELQPEYKDSFDTIRKSTSQLYTVIEDFSRYTQLSKNDDIIISAVDLNEIVDNLIIALSNVKEQNNAKIINHGLVTIKTNPSMIYIILKKIIENGLKFNNSPNPTVSLSAKTYPKFVEIIIADNGIGIEADYREQIFEMFKRLNHRKDFEGSGIGLAIVKLLLNKLGGSVKIESSITKGSTFILQLPV